MKKKVLVTGAGGYIGSILVPSLIKSGYSILAIDRFFFGNYLKKNNNLEIIYEDIRSIKSRILILKNVLFFFHSLFIFTFYLLSSNFINHYRNNVHNEFIRLSDMTDLKMKEYVKSLMNSFPEKTFWADANSTLRLTYGKVEGTFPRDGIKYTWFTTMDGIIEKNNTGNDDFQIPERLKELHKEKNYGKYGNNGNLNICFLGSNHTTGGNSGSPALNAEGLLVGINFDRGWESTMSDVLFDEDICRNIMVDIRYVLWVIDIYAGAGHLVEEMNLVTSKVNESKPQGIENQKD